MPDELVPIPSPGVPLQFGEPGAPLVVVAHDWYGRMPALEPYAVALAHRGFRVAVPDFYDGVCTTSDRAAEALMRDLDVGLALASIEDLVEDAVQHGSNGAAVVGFSTGGWLALLHAQGGSADAAVAYYATLGTADHGVIPCPVLLHFAEFDGWPEGESPDGFVDRLKEHGTPVKRHSYPGTHHSFANASIRDRIDGRAAALAFARTVSFLTEHLSE